MAVIDVHHHMLPPSYCDYLNGIGYSAKRGGPLPKWNPEISLDLMDKLGVDISVLSISESGVYFGDPKATKKLCRSCNDYVAGVIEKYPGRFMAFGVIPLPNVADSIEEIRHVFDDLRLQGVILHSSIGDYTLGDLEFSGVYEELNARDAVAYLHPVHPSWYASAATKLPRDICDAVSDTTRAITALLWNGVLHDFSRIKWIVAHGGGTAPYLKRRLDFLNMMDKEGTRVPEGVSNYLKRLFYDTGIIDGDVAKYLSDFVSPSQLLFGTDLPFAPIEYIKQNIIEMENRIGDPVVAQRVREVNSAQLFRKVYDL